MLFRTAGDRLRVDVLRLGAVAAMKVLLAVADADARRGRGPTGQETPHHRRTKAEIHSPEPLQFTALIELHSLSSRRIFSRKKSTRALFFGGLLAVAERVLCPRGS